MTWQLLGSNPNQVTHLVVADGVRTVVDDELVVAIDPQPLETEHEALQDRLGLERDNAVHIQLIVAGDDSAVDGARHGGEEALVTPLAQLADGNCNSQHPLCYKP